MSVQDRCDACVPLVHCRFWTGVLVSTFGYPTMHLIAEGKPSFYKLIKDVIVRKMVLKIK